MNRCQTTALLGLGLGLAVQTTPAAAWWQWYYQDIPYGPVPVTGFYQTNPWLQGFGPGQSWHWDYLARLAGLAGPPLWQYPTIPYGPTTLWSSTMPTTGLYVEQNETPAGYLIRVLTGQPGAPTVDIGVQGGFLTIRSRAMTSVGGGAMQMHQSGWASQSLALPADANVAAMQMQRGDGVVEIFIPRGR
jgi:hypothetical protein